MSNERQLSIAILGTRGIPANYGGFETFAEELGARLALRGHEVTVYGRSHHVPHGLADYRGVHLAVLPTLRHKYLDTVVHGFLSSLHVLFKRFDVLLVCNAANSPFCLLLRLAGKPVLLNVDGLEWKRRKWNALGRAYYRLCARLSTWFPTAIVSDSLAVQAYYRETYRADSTFIAYGARTLGNPERGTDTLDRFGLGPGRYLLYVSRLEPENNAHVVVKAFESVRTDMRLAVVGSAPYSDEYIARLKQTRDPRIVFTGGVYGPGYLQLQHHAYLYIQATEVGGTHPALVEAMGAGNCIVYNDVPEHREVVGDAGVAFRAEDVESLTRQLQHLLDHPDEVIIRGGKALEIVQARYHWDRIVDQYEDLFVAMLSGPQRSVAPGPLTEGLLARPATSTPGEKVNDG